MDTSQLNSETDFVAKNDQFQNTLAVIAQSALEAGSVTENPTGPPAGTPATLKAVNELSVTVDASSSASSAAEAVVALVGKIRENLVLRRATVLEATGTGIIVPYVHNKATETMGSIGVAVAVACDPMPAPGSAQREALEAVGKIVALQVAATRPLAVDRSSVDAAALEQMRESFAAEAKASGKPEKVVGRIVEGKLNKFFAESCLMEQECITVEGDLTVAEAVKQASEGVGAEVSVQGFRVLVVGDGLEEADEEDSARA
jgi:elongation factor Ts